MLSPAESLVAEQEDSRRSKLNPARLERKRATARDSQRDVRAKTKSYTGHLEATITQLEQSLATNDTRSLAEKVTEQHTEIVRLRSIIRNATRMLAGSVRQSSSNGSDELVMGGPHASESNAVEQTFTAVADAVTKPGNENVPPPLPPCLASGEVALCTCSAQEETVVISCHPAIPPPCGDGLENYFGILSTKLAGIQNDIAFCPLTSAEEDEDVAIRAIIHGWHVAEQHHVLDPIWKLLQATDQGLFYRSGPVERIAVLRLMRSLLLWKVNPFWHPTPKFPAYMAAGPAQQHGSHPVLIDFFVWPALREYLVMSNTAYIPEYAAALFATHLRFRWPFALHDLYLTHRSSARYAFSEVFNQYFEDLTCWTLDEQISGLVPEFAGLIPMSNKQQDHYVPPISHPCCHSAHNSSASSSCIRLTSKQAGV